MAAENLEKLKEIFSQLKEKLAYYSPPLEVRLDEPWRYELWSVKDLVVDGRKRKEIYFAALIIQKDYVGFYFMPIYTQSDLQVVFGPELVRLLKGKSCFHIKKLDENLLGQVEAALAIGFQLYQERGWV